MAGVDCPEVLVNDVGDAAASCVRISEGTLVSTLGHAVLLDGMAPADVALPRLVLDTVRYVPLPARIPDE